MPRPARRCRCRGRSRWGCCRASPEFLPISSDGHLALGQRLLHIDAGGGGHQFTIIVHAGTLLAVIWTYRADLWQLTQALLRARPSDDERQLLVGMIVASAPLGLVLLPGVEDAVIAFESSIPWIGVFLWITGAALWLGFRHERRHPPPHPGRMPSALQALLIGLAQVTAILPGVSRSGTTISSALLLGIDRVAAARFSFLISVIAVGGAVAKEGLDLVRHGAQGSLGAGPAAAGFAASLVVGLLALRALLLLVKRGQVSGLRGLSRDPRWPRGHAGLATWDPASRCPRARPPWGRGVELCARRGTRADDDDDHGPGARALVRRAGATTVARARGCPAKPRCSRAGDPHRRRRVDAALARGRAG
ncbi:MAG: undecaprenyl-diphosphate phosphatase [Deltaproteobacteria bacterium]|nr:undecaprenyl-diphosphate phosphatase [Deltaproteobacteria bacterium]